MDHNELNKTSEKEKEQEKKGNGMSFFSSSSKNLVDGDYKKFFFRHAGVITTILFILGLISAVLIFMTTGDPFKAAAVIFLLVWLVVFLRYFLWAVYHYNVNYGFTIRDWEKIEDAKKRLKEGEMVLESELDEPRYNPYRSQTFGVPPGTVRGMLAFTLLFGAIAILIASMGMDQGMAESPILRRQFEFFETAFLMMMAFYFGDKSLRFLQRRWSDPNTTTTQANIDQKEDSDDTNDTTVMRKFKKKGVVSSNVTNTNLRGDLRRDDEAFLMDEATFATSEGLPLKTNEITSLKDTLNTFSAASTAEISEEVAVTEVIEEFAEDGQGHRDYPCTPIIDAGHGGVIDGTYTTGDRKRYRFAGTENDFEILEGVVNRKIALKLIEKLEENGLPYYNLNVDQQEDMPLKERVAEANRIYNKDKSAYLLSLHSNAASPALQGKGTTANGFEIWTSLNETPSDQLARIAKREYQKYFNAKFKFRGLKEKNLYVLKHTRGPAMLIENLFFDNYQEAQYLLSEEGQEEIANCLLNVVKSIHYYYED